MAEQNRRTVEDGAEVTAHLFEVKIPAEYVDDFRAAVVYEIRFEAECIVKDSEKVTPDERTILERLDKHDDVEVSYGDVRGDVRLMAHDVALFDQLEDAAAPAGGTVALHVEGYDGLGAVAHVFESLAREIVGPRLKEALGVGPIDRDWAAKVREQIERVSGAVDQAAEYHAKADVARQPQAA